MRTCDLCGKGLTFFSLVYHDWYYEIKWCQECEDRKTRIAEKIERARREKVLNDYRRKWGVYER